MIKFENAKTFNWDGAIRGMRNPMNSWGKSDTDIGGLYNGVPSIGALDLALMQKLRKGGADDRKYLRQIMICADITAPFYWWKECDQYKVGTVTNSCSTMHKLTARDLTVDDFSHEHLTIRSQMLLDATIEALNDNRRGYLATNDKTLWYQMIQLLPTSYNQKRTWTANYEVLVNIYHARKNHKLDEWKEFCKWIESLPYAKELIIND